MKRNNIIIFSVILVLVLAAAGTLVAKQRGWIFKNAGIIRDSGDSVSDYTAVFLTNGQVYFGKMYRGDRDMLDLKDIYYLQVDQQKQITGEQTAAENAANNNVVLVKLGEELHGPNDRMLINRQQVLFTESLKKDSKVVKGIADYVASKK